MTNNIIELSETLYYSPFSLQRIELRNDWKLSNESWVDFLAAAELKAQKVADAFSIDISKLTKFEIESYYNKLYVK
jgi:hypothetical protein